MTNIPCSSDCLYQSDGYCTYEHVEASEISAENGCAYFKPAFKKDAVICKEQQENRN